MTKKFFALVLILSLAACFDQKAWLQKWVSPSDDAFARTFIEAVRTGNYPACDKMLAPNLRGTQAAKGLQDVHTVLDHGKPLSVEVVGYNFNFTNGKTRVVLTYQLHFPGSWAVGNVIIEGTGSSTVVVGTNFQPLKDSLEVLNAFTLRGKSLLHYAVLALCLINPPFILYALVACIRTRMRSKWVWMLFILAGVGRLGLDWNTGQYTIQYFQLSLLGVTAFRPALYGAWVVSWGVPLGAVIFLLRQRKLALTGADVAPEA